jgi:hypothetical protein
MTIRQTKFAKSVGAVRSAAQALLRYRQVRNRYIG